MPKEFDIRGKQYYQTIYQYPNARKNELFFVKKWLKPKRGEKILDLGCGSGYIANFIADFVKPNGNIYASDVSRLLIKKLSKSRKPNVMPILNGEYRIPLQNKSVDAIFSYTAFHHFSDQAALMKESNRVLKKGGRMLIFDIFRGTPVSKYADDIMGKYGKTGHEGKWLSKEYIETLCFRAGFEKPRIHKGNSYREFNAMKEMGKFFKNLHSLSCSESKTIQGIKKYIGIRKKNGKYLVPWRIDLAITKKN